MRVLKGTALVVERRTSYVTSLGFRSQSGVGGGGRCHGKGCRANCGNGAEEVDVCSCERGE